LFSSPTKSVQAEADAEKSAIATDAKANEQNLGTSILLVSYARSLWQRAAWSDLDGDKKNRDD
jgi:hypothetical protein